MAERLDRRIMRNAVFLALKNNPNTDSLARLAEVISNILRNQGFNTEDGVLEGNLNPNGFRILREVYWELVIAGLLAPGGNDASEWALFSITEFGSEAFQEDRITPNDPDGFIQITKNYSGVTLDILLYLEEALGAFNKRLFFASVVMLGVSAEGMLYELAKSIKNSHKDPSNGEKWIKSYNNKRGMKSKFNLIENTLNGVKNKMTKQIKSDFDTYFEGTYKLIKQHRDDAGHPTGKIIEFSKARTLFYLFETQSGLISNLIQWLSEEKQFS